MPKDPAIVLLLVRIFATYVREYTQSVSFGARIWGVVIISLIKLANLELCFVSNQSTGVSQIQYSLDVLRLKWQERPSPVSKRLLDVAEMFILLNWETRNIRLLLISSRKSDKRHEVIRLSANGISVITLAYRRLQRYC
jgi:hypothetical protein